MPPSRADIEAEQTERLASLVAELWRSNRFWQAKWAGLTPFAVESLADLERLPLTTKAELVADQDRQPPYGTNLTYPREAYTRLHQTSGTMGKPLRWLDTPESWEWMLGCWRQIFALAEVEQGERVLFPFSFGPFLGFWTAFDAASSIGCLTIPGGGLSTGARLNLLIENEATVLCCTPTYALHLAHAAREQGIDLRARSRVKTLIVAGEPGGSIPATRARIEAAWNARVIDHTGLTEVGPLATECRTRPGALDVLERDYIAEIRDPATLATTPDGEIGELIVTNLGRRGSPLVRYRTGDLVRPHRPVDGFAQLVGGVLGRVDDMIPLRGINFYPSSLEAVIRRFPEVVEYQVEVDTTSPLAELRIDVEPTADAGERLAERLTQAIRDELLFRAEVALAPAGSLPRFEMKASRVKRKAVANS
jgi:phenylacetate-CoA ligase